MKTARRACRRRAVFPAPYQGPRQPPAAGKRRYQRERLWWETPGKKPPRQKRGYVGCAEGRGVCPKPGVEAGEEREKFSQSRFAPGRTRVRWPCFVVVVTSLVLFPSFLRRGETEVADEVGSPARTWQGTRRQQILMRKVMLPSSRYCSLHAQKTTVLGLKLWPWLNCS